MRGHHSFAARPRVLAALLSFASMVGAVGCGSDDGGETSETTLTPAVTTATADEPIALDERPTALAAGAGSVWVASEDGHNVTRVDTESSEVTATIPIEGLPGGEGSDRTESGLGEAEITDISATDDAVWVAWQDDIHAGHTGFVSRIDPATNEVVEKFQVGEVAGDPILATADAVWRELGSDVARIDPATNEVVATIEHNGGGFALAEGAGALWVPDFGLDNLIRIDTGTNEVTDEVPLDQSPSDLVFAAGSIWITHNLAGEIVTRMDPDTLEVIATVPVGPQPQSIAATDDAIWVTDDGDHTVRRIDPETNEVTDTIGIVGVPADIVAADGVLWVAGAGQERTLSRIDPATL